MDQIKCRDFGGEGYHLLGASSGAMVYIVGGGHYRAGATAGATQNPTEALILSNVHFCSTACIDRRFPLNTMGISTRRLVANKAGRKRRRVIALSQMT
jgi:hypothetical protein